MRQIKLKVAAALAAWSVLLAAPYLRAQVVFEWREPDGTVAYSDQIPTAAQGTVTRTLTVQNVSDANRAALVRLGSQTVPSEHPSRQILADADSTVAQAIAQLQQAELALQAGQVPQPGERSGLVNGHSRLNSAYFERIKALEAQVGKARIKMQSAYAQRDVLKQ